VRRSAAIARQEFRLLRNDPGQAIALALIPIVLMAIVKGPVGVWLTIETGQASTGAALAVPGQAALASYLAMVNFGIFFYRDFGTGVWDRLRVGSARPVEIVAGKLMANWLVFLVQFLVAFLIGGALFGLDLARSPLSMLFVAACSITAALAIGLALICALMTSSAYESACIILAMLFGALGGAFCPDELLPNWASGLKHLSPVYWSVRALRRIYLDDRGFGAVVGPCLVLLGIAVAASLVSAALLRPSLPREFRRR